MPTVNFLDVLGDKNEWDKVPKEVKMHLAARLFEDGFCQLAPSDEVMSELSEKDAVFSLDTDDVLALID